MDVIVAKRVMALQRQKAAVKAAVNRGDLTKGEGDVLLKGVDAEVASIRAQAVLPLEQAPAKAGK